MDISRLRFLRTAARVERLHTLKGHHTQTVGEHTFNVYWLAEHICRPRKLSTHLIEAIMQHDVTECVTGDLPGPTKKYPAIEKAIEDLETETRIKYEVIEPPLSDWERDVLTYCDKMEFILHAREEVEAGGMHLLQRVDSSLKRMPVEVTSVTPTARALYEHMVGWTARWGARMSCDDLIYGWPG